MRVLDLSPLSLNLKSNLRDFGEEFSVDEVQEAVDLINEILGEEGDEEELSF